MRRRTIGLCILAIGLADASWAHAQTERGTVVQELVVTARKREEDPQRVPLAVSSATGEALDHATIRQPSDLSRLVPSLTIGMAPGSVNNAVIGLRGQGSPDLSLNTSQAVSLYEDSVHIPHPIGANGAFFDLQRVEVLKGPQGTLYGRNTTGGAINIVTRSPDFRGVHGFVLAEVGNFAGQRYGGAVNLPIVRDVISARLAYLHWGRRGYGRSRITGQRLGGDHDDDLARLSLRVAPDGPLTVEIKYERYQANRQGALSTARHYDGTASTALEAAAYTDFAVNQPRIFQGLALGNAAALNAAIAAGTAAIAACVDDDLFSNCQGTITYDRITTHHGVLDIRWAAETVTLRSLTGYHRFRNARVNDLDGLPYQLMGVGAGVGGLQPDLGSARRPWPELPFPLNDDQESEQFSQEVTLSGRFRGRLDWLVGAYASGDEGASSQHTLRTPTLFRALSPTGTGSLQVPGAEAFDVTNKTRAIFSQNDLALTDRVSVTLGARYTEERLAQTVSVWQFQTGTGRFTCTAAALAARAPQTDPLGCTVDSAARFSGTSYLASLNIQLRPQTLIYLKTSRGFRGGALQARETDTPAAGPETVVDYEIGLKTDHFGRRLRANLAAYWVDYRDKQELRLVTNRLGGLSTLLQNAAKARIRGVEVEITARPLEVLTLSLNASAVDAVYLSFPGAITNTGLIDASGVRFAIPKYRLDVGARYQRALGPGALSIEADYYYRSRSPSSPLNPLTGAAPKLQDEFRQGRGLLNARIEYQLRDQGLTFSLFATNLTNATYQVQGLSGGSVTGGVQNGITQEPRMYGVAVRKTFGGE